MAFGMGVVRGMAITLRHFFDTYTVGQNKQPSAAGDVPARAEATVAGKIPAGMPTELGGIFTSQYPEQKLPVPERFRYIPFLLYEDDGQGERAAFDGIRCTACGICAKVCPPQCIWIVQGKGDDGRPRPVATEFFIDASICMSCGFCAEYCPFDAIKMDHDYEFSSYERHESWVFDIQELLHPVAYHAAIHPADYAREVEETRQKEAAKRQKEAAAAAKAAAAADSSGVDPEEAKRRKAEARQRMLEAKARKEAEGKAGEGGG
ncbi:NADH:ubiquinone oxidoreductase chain I-like protein [bacterium]|nr:4Fe-4S dicluster domain-containing protein [Chloroflexi bacterium CFX6]RIL10161.1 MAG: NADH:ubiquinone oxidoreductase chain I-like protein [bacterium]